jgi:CRISPR-associated protein Cas2
VEERLIVVAYDVANDRRRVRLHQALLEFGLPVQESIFECQLTPAGLERLRRAIRRIVRPRQDNVRLYHLCAPCAERREALAGQPPASAPAVYVV